MKIRKEILLFIASLSSLHILDMLLLNYNLIGGNTWTILYLGAVFCCLVFATRLINDFRFENSYFKAVFILLVIYHMITVARGFSPSYDNIKSYLQIEYLFWPFVIPIFVFFDKDPAVLAEVLKALYYLALVFLLGSIAHPSVILERPTAETFIHPFAFGAGFLLMNARYLSRMKAFICLFVCMVAILSFTYLARRNAMLTYSGFVIASVFLYMKSFSAGRMIRIFPLIVGLMVAAFFVYDKLPDSFTSRINERMTEDTRTLVFDAFSAGMKDDMVFGKGMNGTYYCPFEDAVLDDGANVSAITYRNVIENGYRQLILDGGYIETVLFVLVLLPAGYLGVFKSSNSFTRACGALIILWLIDMIVFGLPRLYIQYIFVWISVGICYQRDFREKPDEEFYEAFNNVGLG